MYNLSHFISPSTSLRFSFTLSILSFYVSVFSPSLFLSLSTLLLWLFPCLCLTPSLLLCLSVSLALALSHFLRLSLSLFLPLSSSSTAFPSPSPIDASVINPAIRSVMQSAESYCFLALWAASTSLSADRKSKTVFLKRRRPTS